MTKNSHSKCRNKRYIKYAKEIDRNNIEKKKIINRLKITVVDEPLKHAIKDYNSNRNGKSRIYRGTSTEVLKRITLNFIRHKLTNYDILVQQLASSSKYISLVEFKRSVNCTILKEYGEDFIYRELLKELI